MEILSEQTFKHFVSGEEKLAAQPWLIFWYRHFARLAEVIVQTS
jgi:hypothetical protein